MIPVIYFNDKPSLSDKFRDMIGLPFRSQLMSGWTQTESGYQRMSFSDKSGNIAEIFLTPSGSVNVVMLNDIMID